MHNKDITPLLLVNESRATQILSSHPKKILTKNVKNIYFGDKLKHSPFKRWFLAHTHTTAKQKPKKNQDQLCRGSQHGRRGSWLRFCTARSLDSLLAAQLVVWFVVIKQTCTQIPDLFNDLPFLTASIFLIWKKKKAV